MVYYKFLRPSSALRRLQHVNASLSHMFYHELIIAMLFTAKYLITLFKGLQQAQNCAAGHVFRRYTNAVDVVILNWLPVLKGIEYNISKLTYQGLNNKNWPCFLLAEIVNTKKTLRSINSGPCVDHGEKHTIQDQTKNAFNKLPINIRSNESKIIFNRQARDFYKVKTLARTLSLYFFSSHMLIRLVSLGGINRCK